LFLISTRFVVYGCVFVKFKHGILLSKRSSPPKLTTFHRNHQRLILTRFDCLFQNQQSVNPLIVNLEEMLNFHQSITHPSLDMQKFSWL
jgi:hypothetical protein